MTTSLLRALAAFGVVSVGLALPRPARACDPPVWVCREALVLPADGSTIPANAQDLIVVPRLSESGSWEGVHLTASDGTTIPLTWGDASLLGSGARSLHLEGRLVPGEAYRIDGVTTGCPTPVPLVSMFFAGPPASRPTSIGALRVVEQAIRETVCGPVFDESFAEFEYTEDPSMAPWRALSFARLNVDGNPFGDALPLTPSWRLAANCDLDGAKAHRVAVNVSVAGGIRDITNILDVDLGCNQFVGCAIGGERRRPDATPARGALFFALGVGSVALGRRFRRKAPD